MPKLLPRTVNKIFVRNLRRQTLDYQRGAADMLRAMVDADAAIEDDSTEIEPQKGGEPEPDTSP